MRVGQYDTWVVFQKKVNTPDGGGGQEVSWAEISGAGSGGRWAALWAVNPSKNDEGLENGRQAHTPDYRLIVRTDALTRQITANCRALIEGEPHNIRSVGKPDRIRGNITLIIQEGAAT